MRGGAGNQTSGKVDFRRNAPIVRLDLFATRVELRVRHLVVLATFALLTFVKNVRASQRAQAGIAFARDDFIGRVVERFFESLDLHLQFRDFLSEFHNSFSVVIGSIKVVVVNAVNVVSLVIVVVVDWGNILVFVWVVYVV